MLSVSYSSLSVRFKYLDLCFVFKILAGVINCSTLLSLFLLRVPNYAVRNYLWF
ncbi:hypothetical protein TcasGA2_TC033907 [Tribolium castaneum]|uniref:Uncharacterized protein n=1 Tax=Tribolium castaneum TaxID=7070 RepID=A0A139W9E9_TRICA|nr:hypothetical protein TcasGA2_TC033907 [Tribolium castaneum]